MKVSKESIIDQITATKIIVIVRSDKPDGLVELIKAISKGGLSVIEVTYNTPGCLDIVKEVSEMHPEIIVGVGTVTNAKQAREAIDAGAKYLVTPMTDEAIVKKAHEYDVPVVMGAFSPTEIHQAYAFGADFIKLFPADYLGPGYLKAVKATLKGARFVPTGGIDIDDCQAWIDVGISAFGIGGSLVSQELLHKKDYPGLTALAAQFKNKIDSIN